MNSASRSLSGGMWRTDTDDDAWSSGLVTQPERLWLEPAARMDTRSGGPCPAYVEGCSSCDPGSRLAHSVAMARRAKFTMATVGLTAAVVGLATWTLTMAAAPPYSYRPGAGSDESAYYYCRRPPVSQK